jgi:hypothetical protein
MNFFNDLLMNLFDHGRIHDLFSILNLLVRQKPVPDETLASLASRDLQLITLLVPML